MCDTNTFEEAVKVNLAWNRRVTLSVCAWIPSLILKLVRKGINGATENFKVLFKIPCFSLLQNIVFESLRLLLQTHQLSKTSWRKCTNAYWIFKKSRDFYSSPSPILFPKKCNFIDLLCLSFFTKMCESGYFPASSVFDKEKIFLLKRCFCVGRLMLCLLAPQLFSFFAFFLHFHCWKLLWLTLFVKHDKC